MSNSKSRKERFVKLNPDVLPTIQEEDKDKNKMKPSSDDFISKTEEEVIRVPDCTYANEENKAARYYLCPCQNNSEGFEPICEACAKSCHKSHHPTLEVPGMNICYCGLSNHNITQEMNKAVQEKLNNAQGPQCFYTKFFDFVPNKGYYRYKDVTYCSICVEYCLHMKCDDPNLSPCEPDKQTCNCNLYHEINIIKLNAEFISRKNFHKHMRLFNYNILFKIPRSKQIYIDPLNKQINEYLKRKNLESNKDFFKNFLIFKILELFSAFSVYWENKFWCVPQIMLAQCKNTKDLFELMSLNGLINYLDEDTVINFVTAKFYFAELMFNYVIRTYVLTHSNCWNIKTILNMNLYQRYFLLHCGREFHIFGKEKVESSEIEDYIFDVLELYDNILKINEKFPKIFDCLMSYVFPTFNRIMKYIIKNNICSHESRKKYFNLVLETLEIGYEKNTGDFKDSVLYIVKSVFYTLIYKQDEACFDYFAGKEIFDKKSFAFQINDDSEVLTKIFGMIIAKNDRTDDPSRTAILDYYLQKTFELLTDKEDFYMTAVNNLNKKQLDYIASSVRSEDGIQEREKKLESIKNSLDKKYYERILMFTSDFENINKDFFKFDCDQAGYFQTTIDILSKFNLFIKNEGINLDEIYDKFSCHNSNESSKYTQRLNKIKESIFFSTFYQRLEEFLHIYYCSKRYKRADEETNYNNDLLIENIKGLLQFLYVLCKDPDFLVLTMNMKPNIFAATFNDVIDTVIPFIERLIEMIYSSSFTISIERTPSITSKEGTQILDSKTAEGQLSILSKEEDQTIQRDFRLNNINFISGVICELIDLNYDNLPVLADLMLLSKKLLKNIDIKRPDYYNIVDAFAEAFKELASDEQIVKKFDDYFDEALTQRRKKAKEEKAKKNPSKVKFDFSKEEDEAVFKEMSKFIYIYYDFLCELYLCDAHFYDSLSGIDILPFDKFEKYFLELNSKHYQNIPIEVEYAISRYYFTAIFPLNLQMSTIKNQLKNLYMPKVSNNLSLIHLSKKLLEDAGKNKTTEILNQGRCLIRVYDNFSISRLFSYKNPNDPRFIYKYYECLILRPLFRLFNLYILDVNNISGKDLFIFFRLIFLFLKITVEFYKTSKPEEKLKASEKVIYDFEEFTIKTELTKSIIEDIYNDCKTFSDSEIQYFELGKMYNIYERNINRIIKISKEESSGFKSMSSFSSLTSDLDIEKFGCIILAKQNSLIETYNDLKEKTYEDNLSLIKSYNAIVNEYDLDPIAYLLKYFFEKIFDNLTMYNSKKYTKDEYLEFNKESKKTATVFKPQNAYNLIYLNSFFYNANTNFQEAFQFIEDELPSNFYDFLIEKVIVGGTLNEVQKLIDIDYLENKMGLKNRTIGRNETISYYATANTIKFFQNLCEGHNRVYQSKFMNYLMDPDNYLYNNKNCYLDAPTSAGYTKFIKTGGGAFAKSLVNGAESTEEKPKEKLGLKTGGFLSSIIQQVNDESSSPKKGTDTIDKQDENTSVDSVENEDKNIEKKLNEKKVSLFNLISYLMEIINDSLHIKEDVNSKLLNKISSYKDYSNIKEIYGRFSDLIVEMIQGTESSNFENFYQIGLPNDYKLFTDDGEFIKNTNNRCFIFMNLAEQIRNAVFNEALVFDPLPYDMKINLFVTINNILSQENVSESILRCFLYLFPPAKLIKIISLYLRGIYLQHCCRIDYSCDEFSKDLSYLELNQKQLDELKTMFETQPHVFKDDYFMLASQMFLFLVVSAEKYKNLESQKIIKFLNKELVDSKIIDTKEVINTSAEEVDFLGKVFNLMGAAGTEKIILERVKPNDHNYTNDTIVTVKFFNKTIKKCEFKAETGPDKLGLKCIYFIVDPHYYYISKNNMENFSNDVDRTSSTTKLKALIDVLNLFMSEIEYKNREFAKSKSLQKLLSINYKDVDFYNFCISIVINFILVIFLKDTEEGKADMLNLLIRSFVSLQILMNIIFLILFYKSKYNFYVLLSLNNLGKDYRLTFFDKLKIKVLDSFLLNDEIYLLIIIILMGLIGVFTKYGAFLFALQLLSCIKFMDTIKEILLAFKIRFTQLVCIIGFLGILIFFYSNFGFYFMINEFNFEINGDTENYCQTLVECTVNYFNHGVRAGGGIGDILSPKSYDKEPGLYILRFVNDLIFYITVVLLLLNMINGVIVTTFSQIREESNKKDEDRQNKCFICNIERLEFEKKKIDFQEHLEYEHNLDNYIKFFVFVKRLDEKDMDADQGFINNCLKEKDIKCFPVNCSLSIGEVEPN